MALTVPTRITTTRRNVLKGLTGAGLVIGFHAPAKQSFAQLGAPSIPDSFPPNAFVRIGTDGAVTVISKHTEMGQGIYTGLATILADELDADWSRVAVESAPVDADVYAHFLLGMQGTGGSSSVPNSWEQYRTVGATARAMLVAAAASAWDCAEAEIDVAEGTLTHAPSGRSAGFGDFAEAARAMTPPGNVELKSRDEFTLIGKSVPKVDSKPKSTGAAQFTIDVFREGMLTAVVAHAPRFGAKLASFDDSKAREVKGVVDVVEIPRGVAVLATNTHAAITGRDALSCEWDDSAAEMRGTEAIVADYRELAARPGATVQSKGDSERAFAEAAQTFEAEYVFPYLSHSTMEPIDCVIEMTDEGRCQIHSGTQMQSVDQRRVAETLGLDRDDVSITTLYAGGGFGRRGNFVPDFATEAATILDASGRERPIKLQYTREDDTKAGFYRPLFLHRLRGALDADGNITAWENRLVGQSFVQGTFFDMMIQNGVDPIAVEGSAHLPYAVPNVAVDYHMAETGVPTLAWRSVGHTHTGYSKETFVDELLHAAGRDPVEGRLALMSDERAKAVIERAAETAGWGRALPEGRARGIAYVHSFDTHVAEIVEISLGDGRMPRVERVTACVDCGTAINPAIIRAQIEGGIGFGLTAALYGEIDIEDGIVKTGNFDTYRLLRIDEMPAVDVHIMPSDAAPTGIGEPGVPPIAPALANAYFALTGERIRRLPFARSV